MESIAKRRQTLTMALLSSIFPFAAVSFPSAPTFPGSFTRYPSLCCYSCINRTHFSGHKSKIHAPNDIRRWWWRWNIVPIDDLLFLIWFSSNYYVTHISIHHNEPHHAIRIGMTQLNDRNKSRIIMAKSIRPFRFPICKEYKNRWWPYIATVTA